MSQVSRIILLTTSLFVAFAGASGSLAVGQEVENAKAAESSIDELQRKATMIAASYDKLEQLILRMAEIEGLTNPQRAALLKRAAQQSSERRTKRQLTDTVTLLVPPAKLKRAIDEEERGLADMKLLLELLLSEDRADRLKAEEQRIRDYIKEVERLIRLQKSAEGQTRGGADAKKLANEQERIAGRTEELADQIRETEEGKGEGQQNEAQGGESEPKDPSSDNKPSEATPGEQKPASKNLASKNLASRSLASRSLASRSRVNRKMDRNRVRPPGEPKPGAGEASAANLKMDRNRVSRRVVSRNKVNHSKANRKMVSLSKGSRLNRSPKTKAIRHASDCKPPKSGCARRKGSSTRPNVMKRSRSRKRLATNSRRPRPSWKKSCVNFARKKLAERSPCSKAASDACWRNS